MKALKVVIELAINEKLEYLNYANICPFKAISKTKKIYPNCILYSVKIDY